MEGSGRGGRGEWLEGNGQGGVGGSESEEVGQDLPSGGLWY